MQHITIIRQNPFPLWCLSHTYLSSSSVYRQSSYRSFPMLSQVIIRDLHRLSTDVPCPGPLSSYDLFNIHLPLFVCASVGLFFVHVSTPYIIAENTHGLHTYFFQQVPMIPVNMSRCLSNAVQQAVILV